jgi:hypothetical protein
MSDNKKTEVSIDLKQISEYERFALIGKSLSIAMKEMKVPLRFETTVNEDRLAIRIEELNNE